MQILSDQSLDRALEPDGVGRLPRGSVLSRGPQVVGGEVNRRDRPARVPHLVGQPAPEDSVSLGGQRVRRGGLGQLLVRDRRPRVAAGEEPASARKDGTRLIVRQARSVVRSMMPMLLQPIVGAMPSSAQNSR